MHKWEDVKIILLDGEELSLPNSYFKMRGDAMFCIENDQGEGNCIPIDNISSICLKGRTSNKGKLSSNNTKLFKEDKKKKGFFSILKK